MNYPLSIMLALVAITASAQDGKRKVLKDSLQSITTATQELTGVSVVARIERTKMNGDVMVTRIVGSPLSNAGTAEDALAHVPGMLMRNGQLEVLGKGTPTYYINGRKVQDPTELQRLSSQQIREVEVINTPGAQFDAQTNAVVRIRTVRRRDQGWGGSFDARDIYSPSHGDNRMASTLNLNYRLKSAELFGGATFDDNQLRGYETHYTWLNVGQQNTYHQEGDTHMDQHYRSFKWNVGAEFQPANDHSLGFRIERDDNLRGDIDYWMTDDVQLNGSALDQMHSTTHTDADGLDSWSANAYYVGRVGKWGIDCNFDYYRTTQSQEALTHELDLSSTRQVLAYSQAKNSLYATRLVLSRPIGQGKLQAGTELTWLSRDNAYRINQQAIADDQSEVREDTYAAFAEYSTLIPHAGMLTLGLRYEHVVFDYRSLLDGSQDVSRRSDNLFPTLSFATQMGELQGSLSYSVKTRRPSFRTLRSNIEYNNRYTLSTGNPTLQNEINHQASLNLRWRYLSGSVNYQRQEDGIYDWSNPYGQDGTVLLGWVNLSKPIHQLSAYLCYNNRHGRWTPSYTVGLQKQWLSFDLPDPREATGTRTVSYGRPMFIWMCNNAFRLPSRRDDGMGAWQLELNSEFLSGFHFGNAEVRNCFWDLQFSVQKSWLENDALSLKLTVSDLTHTAYHNVSIDLGNTLTTQTHINGQSRSVYDPQAINLSLRYKFHAARRRYQGSGAGKDVRERM